MVLVLVMLAINKLYHAFINTDIPESLRLDCFQTAGGSSYGSAAWALTPAIVTKIKNQGS